MSTTIIQNPVINSAFVEPKRHFRFDDDGITNETIWQAPAQTDARVHRMRRPRRQRGHARRLAGLPVVERVTRPTWWPPPDGEPIGEERATELVAWLKGIAPPAVELAQSHLLRQSPDTPVFLYAVPARSIAALTLDADMRGLCIGCLSIPGTSGKPTTIGIALQRNGRLAITVLGDDGSDQAWIEIAAV